MRIGFIGLGVQGLPLALNLHGAGREVRGFDVSAGAMAAFEDAGGIAAPSLAGIARHCEIAFICVATDAQVLEIVTGPGGLLAHVPSDFVIVNHSTVSAETTSALLTACATVGVPLVDAPVSGGARGAEQRTMSFMVGADDDAFALCEPLFRLSGDTILRTGAAGTATIGKLAHQVTIIGNILAMAEGMRLGTAAGLPATTVKAIIVGGLARSFIAETWGDIKMAPHAIPIYAKDLQNSLQLARDLGIEMPGAELMRAQLQHIVP